MIKGLEFVSSCTGCAGGYSDYIKNGKIIRIYKKLNRIEIYVEGVRLDRFYKDNWREKYKYHGILE